MDDKLKHNDPHQDPENNNVDTTKSGDDTVMSSDSNVASTNESFASSETPVSAHDDVSSQPQSAPGGTSSVVTEDESNGSSMMPIVIGVIILALGIIAAMWFFMDAGTQNGDDSSVQVDETAVPNDTEGNPDDVIATVNDEELTRAEFNRIRQQVLQTAQQQGMDLNDSETMAQVYSQATDTLVNTELIRQAAMSAGITASEEEVQDRFDEIVEQVGGQEALEESLQQLGLTEDSLQSDVEQELIIQRYLESSIDSDSLTATDAEIDELYEASGGAEAGLPPLEEVRPQIEQQILANKENEMVNELVESLRAEADIELML